MVQRTTALGFRMVSFIEPSEKAPWREGRGKSPWRWPVSKTTAGTDLEITVKLRRNAGHRPYRSAQVQIAAGLTLLCHSWLANLDHLLGHSSSSSIHWGIPRLWESGTQGVSAWRAAGEGRVTGAGRPSCFSRAHFNLSFSNLSFWNFVISLLDLQLDEPTIVFMIFEITIPWGSKGPGESRQTTPLRGCATG